MITKRERGSAVVLLLTSVGLVLAGCTGTTTGTASPTTSTSGTSSSTTSSTDPFNGLRACSVLDKALQGEGFPAGHIDQAGGDNGCGSDKSEFGSIGLTLDDQQGIDTLTGSAVRTGTINNDRPARIDPGLTSGELPLADGGCAIVMEVTKSSRALVGGHFQLSTDDACAFVQKIAERIDPQLPAAQ